MPGVEKTRATSFRIGVVFWVLLLVPTRLSQGDDGEDKHARDWGGHPWNGPRQLHGPLSQPRCVLQVFRWVVYMNESVLELFFSEQFFFFRAFFFFLRFCSSFFCFFFVFVFFKLSYFSKALTLSQPRIFDKRTYQAEADDGKILPCKKTIKKTSLMYVKISARHPSARKGEGVTYWATSYRGKRHRSITQPKVKSL